VQWLALLAALALGGLIGEHFGEERGRRDVALAFEAGARTGAALAKPPRPPDLRELHALLAAHGDIRLGAAQSCPNESLGDYLESLVHESYRGCSSRGSHAVRGGCGEFPFVPRFAPPDPDPAYWDCELDSWCYDGDGPVHAVLRARVRRDDRTPDLVQLRCD
jgi:hypothetical protein